MAEDLAFRVDFNTPEWTSVVQSLERLMAPNAGIEMRDLLLRLRALLLNAQEARFDSQVGLGGQRWAPDSLKSTVPRKGHGEILYWTGALIGGLHAEVDFAEGLITVRSGGVPYAQVMQQGAARGAFGADAAGHPIPWGTIPPRPFLGLDPDDIQRISQSMEQRVTQMLSGKLRKRT